MSFEFEYERPDERPTPPPRLPKRRGGSSDLWRRLSNLWRRLARPGRIAVVVVLVLAVSTIITSRERGSDQLSVEDIAATVPTVETNPVQTTTRRPTTTAPAVTQQAVVEPEPSPTQPPPVTTVAPVTSTIPSSLTVDWAELALSVVYVEAGECPSLPSDMFSSGSGTVVLDGTHVLTNAHVILDDNGHPCRDIVVWFTRSFEEEPSEWVLADLAAADRALDLAVLQLSEPVSADRGIEVAAQQLEPGETIRILGYPDVGGLTMTLTRGVYSGMVGYGSERYIKTDADISEGNSGGGAFDEAGAFIGVPTAGVEQVGLLIPAGVAEQFLDRAVT